MTLPWHRDCQLIQGAQCREESRSVSAVTTSSSHSQLLIWSSPSSLEITVILPSQGWKKQYGGSQRFEEIHRYLSVKKVLCTSWKYFMYKARSIPFYTNSWNPKYHMLSGKYGEVYIVIFSYASHWVNTIIPQYFYFQILIFHGKIQVYKRNSSSRKILFESKSRTGFLIIPNSCKI